ncbi:MAG: HAD hydrolase-like protein, partial [Clostridiales bacterium]|nr:HAD hydrolase-like protein [Clostridiales bacterium]
MPYQCIVWDFNGTIADDLAVSIDAINKVLAKRGLPCIKNTEEYRRVFGFPIREYYRRLGFDFEKEPYEIPAKEWVDAYTAGLSQITLVPGVRQVIEEIQKAGIIQM